MIIHDYDQASKYSNSIVHIGASLIFYYFVVIIYGIIQLPSEGSNVRNDVSEKFFLNDLLISLNIS